MEQDLKNWCANNKISWLAAYPVEPQLPFSFFPCVCWVVFLLREQLLPPTLPFLCRGSTPPHPRDLFCFVQWVMGLTAEVQPGCPPARHLPDVHQENRPPTCCSRSLSARMRGANLSCIRPTAWTQPSRAQEAWRSQGHPPRSSE